MQKLVLICLVLLAGHFSFSQKYSFVTYSTEEGLPQSQVTAIGQGDDGYLWVGTLGGLAKFNGKEFKTFSANDGLWNNRVHFIDYFDDVLWIGHDGGISLISKKQIQSFGFTGADQSRKVSGIVKFKNRVIVCTTVGGLFEFKNNKLLSVTDTEINRIRSAHVHNDKLYLATRSGILETNDLETFKEIESLGNSSFYGVTGDKNQLVFAQRNGAIFRMDLKSNEVTKHDLDTLTVSGCYIDKEENVWVNTDAGVVRVKKNGNLLFLNQSKGLPVNTTGCFYQDDASNIWIGSRGKGIFRFPGLSFQYFDQSNGFPSDLFLNGYQKKNGDFYFGTYDKGIVKKTKNGKVTSIYAGEDYIWASVQNVDGKDWFGTEFTLLSVGPNDEVQRFGRADGAPGTKIVSFYKIDNESMYIGGHEGVVLYRNGVFKKLGSRDEEYLGTVRDIAVVNDVLYCVSNLGLFVYRNNNFHPVEGASSVFYSVESDDFGNLWLGAEEGLFVLRKGKKAIMQVKLLRDDPGSNFINFINHRDKKLYVGTNNGLFVLKNLHKAVSYTRYGIGDGIPDLETNLNSGFFDNSGNFWFGTASGLVCFHQEVDRLRPSLPIANLSSIMLNYSDFNYSLYSDELDEDGLPVKLVLPYSKNNLIFKLDGVSLVHHRGLKYQFWLVGLSDGWSPLTDVSTITFTSLPAGDYTLRMRAVDIDGRKSEEITIPFVINQAFYKTWWFILICLISGGGIILLIFRFRLRRINELNEKEKLQFKSRLLSLEQKSVNASMNRHFIFNALNSIQYFINTQDRLSANKYLTNFAQLIRKNLDTATSDHNTISLEEEIARLKLYLSLESMRFKDRFEYEITADDVDIESIMIPAMIMQPFIENSIIHGILPNEEKKGLISIRMTVVDEMLEITIEDNGIGVDQSISQKNQFDGDHRSQGMEITAKRIDLIGKVSNQDISLEGPVEVLNDDRSIKGTRVLLKMKLSNLEN